MPMKPETKTASTPLSPPNDTDFAEAAEEPKKPVKVMLESKHDLSPFTDDEAYTYPFGFVKVDPANREMIACDARVMVVTKLHDCQGEEPFLINGLSLGRAFKIKRQLKSTVKHEVECTARKDNVVLSLETYRKESGPIQVTHPAYMYDPDTHRKPYPNKDSVWPAEDAEFALSISLSPTLLNKICNHALQAESNGSLRFRFRESDQSVLIELHTDNRQEEPGTPVASYLLMPMSGFPCDLPRQGKYCMKPVEIPFTILVSGAEQARYWFTGLQADAAQKYRPLTINSKRSHLETGDYTIEGMQDRVAVERKSVPDLLQTLADGRDRFRREHERMAKMEAACVMIEGTWPEIILETHEHGVTPKVALRTWLSWSIDFGIPWYAVGPRRLAEILTFRFLQKFWEKNHK